MPTDIKVNTGSLLAWHYHELIDKIITDALMVLRLILLIKSMISEYLL